MENICERFTFFEAEAQSIRAKQKRLLDLSGEIMNDCRSLCGFMEAYVLANDVTATPSFRVSYGARNLWYFFCGMLPPEETNMEKLTEKQCGIVNRLSDLVAGLPITLIYDKED